MAWHWGSDVLELRNLENGMSYSEYAQSIGFRNGDILWSVDDVPAEDGNFHNAILLGNKAAVKRNGELVEIALPDTIGKVFLRDQKQLALFASPRYPMVVAGLPSDNSPAAKAGMQIGDSIVGVNGNKAIFGDEVRPYFAEFAGDSIQLDFYRGDSLMTASLVVNADSTIGIALRPAITAADLTHIDYTFLEAIPAGIQRGWDMLYNYVRQFKLVFTKEGAQSLGGFGTMGSIFPETWSWMIFWSITAFFSVALAFMNILPIPGLDGGHILILLIETIIRRPISDKAKDIAQYVGFGIVIALMVYVNANDIWKFIIKPWLG